MKKLIIDRKRWRRGFEEYTYLLSSNGMCCLGFDAINEGFNKSDIYDRKEPGDLRKNIEGLTETFGGIPKTLPITRELMGANDDIRISEVERETQITKLFAKIGRDVEFIN